MAQDKAVVAAVRTTPETVIEDYARVMELAGFRDVIDPTKQTILKNNISWHLLYPSANTTPWQVEGVAKTLRGAGYNDMVVVENRTVVTQGGEHLNNFTGFTKVRTSCEVQLQPTRHAVGHLRTEG